MRDSTVVGCHDPERVIEFYEDLHGRGVAAARYAARQMGLTLPSFIPVVVKGVPEGAAFRPDMLHGVSLGTLLKPDGDLRYDDGVCLRRWLGLPDSARLALFGTVDDTRLERLWHISEERKVWSRVANLRLEFATSMTFSVWQKHPRFDQIYNQERNFATCDYLCAAGVASVPFLFFYKSRSDYEFVINWLRERSDVRKAAILAQFHRTCVEFEELLGFMRSITKDVGRPLDFIVVGAASGSKIRRVLAEFKTATIATSQPVMKAIKGAQLSDELTYQPLTEGDRALLVGQNIERYRIFCERVSGRRKAAVRVKRQDAKKPCALNRSTQVNYTEAKFK